MDPEDDFKWSAASCDDGGVIPVCEYPHPPDNTYIKQTTGWNAL